MYFTQRKNDLIPSGVNRENFNTEREYIQTELNNTQKNNKVEGFIKQKKMFLILGITYLCIGLALLSLFLIPAARADLKKDGGFVPMLTFSGIIALLGAVFTLLGIFLPSGKKLAAAPLRVVYISNRDGMGVGGSVAVGAMFGVIGMLATGAHKETITVSMYDGDGVRREHTGEFGNGFYRRLAKYYGVGGAAVIALVPTKKSAFQFVRIRAAKK